MEERLSIAPMMEWTDPHYRMFMRGITSRTVLYTEMIVDNAAIHSKSLDFFIGKEINSSPSVIQLGGHDPELLGKAAEIVHQYSYQQYDEINLNCGCPSQRVAKRSFGAKLMLEPLLVKEIVTTMQRKVSVPITVKCRIGADYLDKYNELCNFLHIVSSSNGPKKFIIHSRKCFLNGLSTKQNRDVPPLRYDVVHRLVKEFPELKFVINGGINTLEEGLEHLDTNYSTPSINMSNIINIPQVFNVNNVETIFHSVHKKGYHNYTVSEIASITGNSIVSAGNSVSIRGVNSDGNSDGNSDSNAGNSSTTDVNSVHNDNGSDCSCADVGVSTNGNSYGTDYSSINYKKNKEIADYFYSKEYETYNASRYNYELDDNNNVILPPVHGVMIGRAAYNNPLMFATADSQYYNTRDPCLTRREIIERYMKYCEWVQSDEGFVRYNGKKIQKVSTSVLIGAFRNVIHGIDNVGRFRTLLNDIYVSKLKGVNGRPNPCPREVIEGALECISDQFLDEQIGNSTIDN